LTSSRETLRFLGNKIHGTPRNESLSVNYIDVGSHRCCSTE